MTSLQRRLLLVEDEPLTAALLAEVLGAQDFVIETAHTFLDARQALDAFDPDVVLLDIGLGDGPSGIDLAHIISQQRPDIAVLFLTKQPDHRVSGDADPDLAPGVGYLRKDKVRDTEYLLEAINAVLSDRAFDVRDDRDPARPLGDLSTKQLHVLRLMALGYTNDAIAARYAVSLSTVERWAAAIFKSLGIPTTGEVNPRVEAVRRFVAVAGVPDRA